MHACATNAGVGFSVNVKTAPQFSFLTNKTDYDNNQFEYKATFNASFGVGGNYNFTKNAGVELDVLYSLQGQTYTVSGIEYKQNIDYVKVPLLFSYKFYPAENVSFVGKIGFQLSFRTSTKLKDKDGETLLSNTDDKYETATFGGMTLAGTQFRLNKKIFLTTAIRYDIDFTNAENTSYTYYPAGRDKTYNSTVGLEVGLKVLLK